MVLSNFKLTLEVKKTNHRRGHLSKFSIGLKQFNQGLECTLSHGSCFGNSQRSPEQNAQHPNGTSPNTKGGAFLGYGTLGNIPLTQLDKFLNGRSYWIPQYVKMYYTCPNQGRKRRFPDMSYYRPFLSLPLKHATGLCSVGCNLRHPDQDHL